MAIEFNNNKTLYDELSRRDSSIDELNFVVQEYSDYFLEHGEKKFKSKNLGEKFAAINSYFFDYLKGYHIPTAFVKNKKSQLKFIKHVRLPFTVKIFNTVDKRTAKLFHKKENEPLPLPVFEFHYGEGRDTLISESHLITFDLCTNEDIKIINRICSKVNAVLKSYFERRNTVLAEVCCNFGKADDKIYIVDDFTPKSIKILSNGSDRIIDPYHITTANEIKKYTDLLFNLTSA
jgi:phosphoribosylaminoimidazole-succinocarboxamide synthase